MPQHNKRREELHRLQERLPAAAARLEAKQALAAEGEGASDGTSSSDDEEVDVICHTACERLHRRACVNQET